MNRALAALALGCALSPSALFALPAGADEDTPAGGPNAAAGDDALFVSWEDRTKDEIRDEIANASSGDATPAESEQSQPASTPSQCWDETSQPLPDGEDAFYVPALGAYMPVCGEPDAAESQAQPARITPGRVLQAFRRIPLPAAELDIQPPGGKTLVNLETILSTTTEDLDRTITLLGRRIQLRITPATYTWHHGDGTTQTSDWPGRPWEDGLDMNAYLTHTYDQAHVTVRPSVDVTYGAEYRLGNRPWQPVDGTVTIEGPPTSLRILEARPVLTGDGH